MYSVLESLLLDPVVMSRSIISTHLACIVHKILHSFTFFIFSQRTKLSNYYNFILRFDFMEIALW